MSRAHAYIGGEAAAGTSEQSDTEPIRVHEGFSEALGLPLQTADGKQLFVPKRTRYYRTDGARASYAADGDHARVPPADPRSLYEPCCFAPSSKISLVLSVL